MKPSSILTICLSAIFAAAVSSQACAQSLPAQLRISPEFALAAGSSLPAPSLAPGPQAPAALDLDKKLKMSRFLLATGAGLVFGSLLSFAVFGRSVRCGGERQTSNASILSGVTGGLGLVFTLGGAFNLRGVPRDYRTQHRMSPALPLGTAAVAAATTAAGFLASLDQAVDCSD